MKEEIAALFDFDGVVMDTETQYSEFWNKQGERYLNTGNFGRLIKGQTLAQIFDKYFSRIEDVQQQICKELDEFEEEMTYEYLPGIELFFYDLHKNGVKMALVTSSNDKKMSNVYRIYPRFQGWFDKILTSNHFTRSKPNPECFLLGMQLFKVLPRNTYVFEDSFHGLQAGIASGATVVGLATTNSREAIADKADYIIDDFTGMTFERMITLRKVINCLPEYCKDEKNE
ncbi:Phosphorylated carbohydrates phosphatase [termite gut metagenome]|uniref:Phosphorylated carbohydrates phosphatase n=1 Tax=termite gut metagenome TaxID=433724 RepID=A0A5J4SIJ4_9ZZZZ